ncbi:MAG: hypothetical protein K6G01_07275 [Eubacterium sp.]|nr:hypothetical protein [Eubacterium sp.]
MKKVGKGIALLLACAIVVTGLTATMTQAKVKTGPRLSAGNYTLTTESGHNTFNLRLYGGRGKTAWSVTRGSDVISLKKENKRNYTVTAKKAGTAVIAVKVQKSKRTLQCKVQVIDLKAPTISARAGKSAVLLRWKGIQAADYYEIYRRTGKGDYHLIRSFTDDDKSGYAFADYTVASGVVYTYRIRSVHGKLKSNSSKPVTVKVLKSGKRF